MENTKETLELLNDLVLINNDRIEGFERAIKELKESGEDTPGMRGKPWGHGVYPP